ncbi:MAG: DUF5615 family PIN-like protein, partial [Candidatus Hodarchaeota archaeon]
NTALKFLLDENIPKTIVEDIVDLGHDVVHVRLVNPGISDEEIIHQSEKEKRIIITLDKDFGYLVYNQDEEPHGVILIRIHPASPEIILSAIKDILKEVENLKIGLEGNFLVFDGDKLRVRPI